MISVGHPWLAREEARLRAWSAWRAEQVFDPRPHAYEGLPQLTEDGELDGARGQLVPFETWAWAVENDVAVFGR